MLVAVILAAGDSSRMGAPKAALLTPDGDSFVARIVRTLRDAHVDDLVIVTGRHHNAVIEALTRDRVVPVPRIVRNPDPSRGQLSSLLAGMDVGVTPNTEAVMMTLVDVPLVRVSTVIAVIDTWRQSRAPIVRPAIGDRHGHPVIFDRGVLDEIRGAPLDTGAKSVVRAHEHELVNVPVDDEGCVRDVDTPSDYDRLLK
ncbi:MAG TPA: nucleotidyltransferase family protein [Vicinamibacterales bacterium]|nr:nucleotidyltransferase family protein [Vicinamibacterales bacterium]